MSPLANAVRRVLDYRDEAGVTNAQALAEIAAREEWTPGQLESIRACFNDYNEFTKEWSKK
jgi:hypothetical protein